MGLWTGLNVKTEIEPIKLNIKRDFIDYGCLENDCVPAINEINKSLEEYEEKTRKQYELLVLSELHNRGYDLLRLENSNCWRKITPGIGEWDREEFYVDDVLVFTVKKTTRFENIKHKYMVYTDFEIE